MKKRIWYQMIYLAAVCGLLVVFLVGCHGVPAAAAGLTGNTEVQMSEALKESERIAAETVPVCDAELTLPQETEPAPSGAGEPAPSQAAEPVPPQTAEPAPSQAAEAEPTPMPEPDSTELPAATPVPTELPATTPIPAGLPTPKPAEKMDFSLTVIMNEENPKAGGALVYLVTVENTGDCDVKDLELQPLFADAAHKGAWETAPGLNIYEGEDRAVLGLLERGCSRELFYYLEIPEEQTASVRCVFSAKASAGNRPDGTASWLRKEVELETGITPLTIQFTVKKTADRSKAAPGDTITYQICIRNTGERVLHSVLTTERFQTEGIQAHFLEKEGVLLNGAATQALISKIEPGEAVGLLAEVTLPEEIAVQELINEVSVVTKETGEEACRSEASVQVVRAEEPVVLENPEGGVSQAQRASTQPKTSDAYAPEAWAGLFLAAAAALAGIFWGIKGKRKH